MIFAGDVAIAHDNVFQFKNFNRSILSKLWCFNLEGPIAKFGTKLPSYGVYNTPEWTSSFNEFKLGPVFLGNNHICDIHDGIRLTLSELRKSNLEGFGVITSINRTNNILFAKSGIHTYCLLGFGWPVIGCTPASSQNPGVNRLEEDHVLKCALNAVESTSKERVVVVIHGNYEFERYPQPGHRRLSKLLVDLGVYAVIWHHPHIVGPVEQYKGRTIAYSLGNWAFSYGRFFEGRLCFPESTFHQIAIELGDNSDMVHHAFFEPPLTINYKSSERVDDLEFSLKPPFEGYSDTSYHRWFKINRIKRKGLPIYSNAMDTPSNWLRDKIVSFRQILIDTAAKTGLKSMQRKD